MIVERPSNLPRAITCPASRTPPKIRVVGDDEAARGGTAFHDGQKCHITGDNVDVAALAAKYEVDAGDLAINLAMGRNQWSQVADQFPKPQVEQRVEAEWVGLGEVDDLSLAGTPDLFSLRCDLDAIYILDWKSGFRQDLDHTDQMLGYAAILLDIYQWAKRVVCCILRVREGAAYWETYERSQVEQWLGRTIKRLAQTDQYAPGRHCGYCPRGHECEAKTALIVQSGRMLLGDVMSNLPLDPVERADYIGMLNDAKSHAEKICKELGPLLRAEVVNAGGAMPLSDGRELYIKEITKKEIEFKPAKPILVKVLGGDLDECLEVSKSAAEKLVKDRAPNKMKGRMWDELMARLDEAGAVNHKIEQRLGTRRVPLAIAK